jgi:hypothetical protein
VPRKEIRAERGTSRSGAQYDTVQPIFVKKM